MLAGWLPRGLHLDRLAQGHRPPRRARRAGSSTRTTGRSPATTQTGRRVAVRPRRLARAPRCRRRRRLVRDPRLLPPGQDRRPPLRGRRRLLGLEPRPGRRPRARPRHLPQPAHVGAEGASRRGRRARPDPARLTRRAVAAAGSSARQRKVRRFGTEVVLIQPTAEDHAVMGRNLMSAERRQRGDRDRERTVAEQLRDARACASCSRACPQGEPHKISRPPGPPSSWPEMPPRGQTGGMTTETSRESSQRRPSPTAAARAAAGAASASPSLARIAGRLIGAVAEQAQRRVPAADLDERDPDYIRETLPGLWMLASLYFRADVRGLEQHPRGGPGAAGGQPLGRQPDAGHARLHARVQHLLRRRAALLPARPQPRAVDARARLPAQVRHGRGHARRTPSRRSTRAPRCSSTRAATTRSTGPTWESARVDFGGRKGFIRLAQAEGRADRPGGRRSAARRRRSSSSAARGSPGCSASTACSG